MRKVSGFLAVASFFWLYGTIGAVEQDMLSLGTGTIHMILALTCFYAVSYTHLTLPTILLV